jgi:isopenicillin N synthase-like dioxygenase
MTDALPTLSLEPLITLRTDGDAQVAQVLEPILHTWGAFRLVDHGVPSAVIADAFASARLFFAQPLESRLTIKVGKHNRGYAPMHQTVYPGNLPDLKESFNLGLPLTTDDPDVKANKPLHGVNVWPGLPGFRAPVEAYFNAMMTLGSRMLGPLALCLGMKPQDLWALYRKPIAFMRLFHYPPGGRLQDGEHGAAEHQDYGFLTILAQDAAGGLEVRAPDGTVAAVEPQPDTFIINIGDMLAEISGGTLRSAPHRVINRAGIGRFDSVLLRSRFRCALRDVEGRQCGRVHARKVRPLLQTWEGHGCRIIKRVSQKWTPVLRKGHAQTKTYARLTS